MFAQLKPCSAGIQLRFEASRLFGSYGWMAEGWVACEIAFGPIGFVMLPFFGFQGKYLKSA